MKQMRLGLVAVLAALTCIAGAFPAQAGSPLETRAKVVHYHDLDPSTRAGAAALYRRITAAAQSVCADPEGSLINLAAQQDIARCTRDAIAAAVARLNNPLVAALSRKHSAHRSQASHTSAQPLRKASSAAPSSPVR